MKKILSLLALLVMTLTAFAKDYTGHRTVTYGYTTPTESDDAVVSITDNGDGTYNVTFKDVINVSDNYRDNYGTYTFSNVEGTTANGYTTIDLTGLTVAITNCDLGLTSGDEATLLAKFNDEKAYAKFSAKIGGYYKSSISAEFGKDDFGSTGGGGTVETTEGPLVEAGLAPNGAKIEAKDFTINWDTHKVVAKLDLTNCQGVNETIFSFANNAANLGEWNVSNGAVLHFYYTKDADVWTATGWQKLTNTFCIQFRNSDKLGETPTKYVQVNDPSNVRVELRQDGVYIDGTLAFEASDYAKLLTYNDLVFGSTQGENRSNATYKYVEVVGLDWTEPATVVDSKKFTDNIFITQYGTTVPLDLADVTINEMSDGTINMSVVFDNANQTIKSSDLVKGTDEKNRTTYTGTTEVSMMNYDVKAVLYTKDDAEKIFIDMVAANGDKYTVGTDPDYVAPDPKPEIEGFPVDGSVDFAPNGQSFEWTNIPIDWNTQKLVAVIDLSTCGDYTANENILSVGENIGAWKIGGWHFYYTKSAKRMKADYLTTGGSHPVSDAHEGVEAGTVRIELSKADGCTIDGESFNGLYTGVTGDWKDLTSDFWTTTSINIGSKEGANRSNATIKYVTVVDLENEPEPIAPTVYKNTLKVVRNNETQTYEEAEVKVLAKEEGKYEVTIPAFSDMDGVPGQVGPVTFEATGTESEGNTVLTAENQEFTLTNVGWKNDVVVVSMNGTIADGQLTGTFNVVFKNDASYTFNLYYGVEPPVEVTEVSNNSYTSNLRIWDSESEDEENLFQADEAVVNVVKYSDESYKITLKQITLNEQTADLVFTGTEQRATPYDEGGTVETEETMIVAKPDAATEEFLGGEGEEIEATFQIVNVSENEIKMALNISGNTFSYDGEFNYDQPEEPKEDYAINFEKDAKQTHSSRYSTSVSLTVNGQAQTIEFGKTMNGYEDLTAQSFTVTPGAEVTPAIGYVGEWMHGYVYVDLNNDKQFSFNADSDDQTGTEVVSYSFYSASNGSTGLNSKGETVSNNCNVNPLPSFTAPAEEGTYRIRFKVDWNSVDAGGCVVSGNNILNNGGGIYDATLVVKDVTDGIDSINAEAANAELFTVDGVKISKLQKGLNIVRTADGKVKKVVIK
ncbi:calycin-like domain-containing protein [uncultured Prevotella sp.]|uniref:calycin-like domain-containing protein n=1 Tax=uncultured Prevotella sp. TaxID=159272 RepID=UPI0027E24D17|nr:calycin-like domain-containing protein [uncultured Prevotella sp.]